MLLYNVLSSERHPLLSPKQPHTTNIRWRGTQNLIKVVFVMEMAIVLVVAAVIVGTLVMRSRNWQTIMAGNGRSADEVHAKYAFLKANQVKCKLKTEENAPMGAVHGGGSYAAESSSNVRLDVHKKDVDRASELLQTFDKEAEF